MLRAPEDASNAFTAPQNVALTSGELSSRVSPSSGGPFFYLFMSMHLKFLFVDGFCNLLRH